MTDRDQRHAAPGSSSGVVLAALDEALAIPIHTAGARIPRAHAWVNRLMRWPGGRR